MKSFLIGTVVALAALLIGYLADDWSLAYWIAGAVGLLALLWEGLIMSRRKGSARSTSSEKRREQREKLTKMRMAFLFALPNLIVAIIALLIFE